MKLKGEHSKRWEQQLQGALWQEGMKSVRVTRGGPGGRVWQARRLETWLEPDQRVPSRSGKEF